MRPLPVAAAAAVLVIAVSTPAQGATGSVAQWGMNEPAGASTMSDSSGNGLKGYIGSDVQVGTGYAGATGYRFPTVEPDEGAVRPEHTVVVQDDNRLNPGWADFGVELRVRTHGNGGNIIQKGQSRSEGGFWKVELNAGEPTCVFRGADGITNAVRARGLAVSDGAWHTIKCEQSLGAVDLWVDGHHVGRNLGRLGSIANGHPVSIGGKQRCDQENVGCDYFSGTIDWISITKS